MLSSNEIPQSIDAPETGELETGALERLSTTTNRRHVLSERRQSILQQKQTDSLPQLDKEAILSPHAKIAWRQVIQLREENRRLRSELETQRQELQQLLDDPAFFKKHFGQEVSRIESSYKQELEEYQKKLQLTGEENKDLQARYTSLEQQYQELYHTFQVKVEEEARKMIIETAKTLEITPDSPTDVLQDIVKTVELRVRQQEDKHLLEALYLKRELQRMAAILQKEREQIEKERQNLFAMQYTAREQAQLRQKVLQEGLRARWIVKSVTTTIGALFLLLILQFLFLTAFRIPLEGRLSFSLIAPVVVGIMLAILVATPLKMIKQFYEGAPHRVKDKR
jgi:hypothetical protein